MLPPAFDLSGRVALVTGAGSADGIGFACARMLASLGAAVAVTATSERVHERAAELRAGGAAGAFGCIADLTVPDQVTAVARLVTEQLGPVAVLVNNAGMTSVQQPAMDGPLAESGDITMLSPELWDAALQRNLSTAFLSTRAVLASMRAQGWGRVVMVASVTGPLMAMRHEPAYAAAKAAMVGLARAVAVDCAGDGVTANAVAPGWVTTASQTVDEVEQGRATPVGRSATQAEIAAAVAFLCTPGAAYVTGQCLVVDGGNSIAEERR